MNAVIIPPSKPYSLAPLCSRKDIGSLPIFGTPLSVLTGEYLHSNKIDSITMFSDVSISELTAADNPILLIRENIITDLDLGKAIESHINGGADMTAFLTEPDPDDNSGGDLTVTLNSDGRIGAVSSYSNNANPFLYSAVGIFILGAHPVYINSLSADSLTGENILSLALAAGKRINGYLDKSAAFVSVSTQTDYIRCHKSIMQGKLSRIITKSNRIREIRPGFFIEGDAEISGGVSIEPPVFISDGCRIQTKAKLGPDIFIGKNCTVGTAAEVSDSVIGKKCILGEYSCIDGAVLGDDINLGAKCRVAGNTIIGNGCRFGSACRIDRGVRIWHNKRVEEKTRISASLLHASLATERLFRNGRIDGEINTDITPEFMAKLGSALGTMFPQSKIGICSASSPICNILARAAAAGVSSTGSTSLSFGEQPLPLFRCGILYHRLTCGIHISQSSDRDIFFPEITVIASDGADFDGKNEQSLEDIFFGGIFTRCSPDKVTDSVSLSGFRMKYTRDILNSVKSSAFNKNMEIRTVSESVSEILEAVLGELEQITKIGSKKEFEVDIAPDGQSFYLYSADKVQIDKQTLFAICAKLYCEYFEKKQIVLPLSVSDRIRSQLDGVEIIECGISDYEFIKAMLSHGLIEQFRVFFDGIFFSVILLDCLNCMDISFDEFVKTIPSVEMSEEEVECPNIRKSEIIRKLYEKYGGENPGHTDGIKIYQSNGWVLIIPEKYRHCIKVITEGYTAEAANEISAIFTNQIKRLAKPN